MNYCSRLKEKKRVDYNEANLEQLQCQKKPHGSRLTIERLDFDEAWISPIPPPNVVRLETDDEHEFYPIETVAIEKINRKSYFIQSIVDMNGRHDNVPVNLKETPWESVANLVGSVHADIVPEWVPRNYITPYYIPDEPILYENRIGSLFWHNPETDPTAGVFLVRLTEIRRHVVIGQTDGEYNIVSANPNSGLNGGFCHALSIKPCDDADETPPSINSFDTSIRSKLIYALRRSLVCLSYQSIRYIVYSY